MTTAQRDCYQTINFEETELRLGLPGGTPATAANTNSAKNGKRGFDETEDHVDLKLNLSSSTAANNTTTNSTAAAKDVKIELLDQKMKEKVTVDLPRPTSDNSKPPAKTQVVGWPPVRAFRRNIMAVQKPTSASTETVNKKKESAEITPPAADKPAAAAAAPATTSNAAAAAAFVKVSMDGAPYLRKVDLKLYKSYQELSDALTNMFSSFTNGKDLTGENHFVPTYEDKDGDWMLVGDVPWVMFVNSCKRLRIMKGSEAVGLSPRAVLREKCKPTS